MAGERFQTNHHLLRALSRSKQTHVVWVAYCQLLALSKNGVVDLTTSEIGACMDVGRTTLKNSLKLLRQLELIEGPIAVGEGWQIVVHRDGTLATWSICCEIIAGKAVADINTGTIDVAVDVPSLEIDFTPGQPTDQSGDSSSSSFSLVVNKESSTTRSGVSENAEPTKRVGRNSKAYVPLTDERRPDIEEIQAYANELFKTKHGLLTESGQEIGKATGVSGRYGIIRRALVNWGFTKDQLKGALLMASKDQWWVERKINDTTQLFRKIQHIQRWVDLFQAGGTHPTFGKWDKKQVGLAMSKVADKDGKLDRSKLDEEVF